jgi:RTX calcium-binding nonapeptide repeat (4 copies)
VVRRGHLIAVVSTFLIGCAVLLLVVGCAGTSSETSKKEQGSSPKATSEEEARCEGTRTLHSYTIFYRRGGMVDKTGSEEDMKKAEKKARHIAKREDLGEVKVKMWGDLTTNDLPGCPKGGLLLGTDKNDELNGEKGDDEIRGLGGSDALRGGPGSDVLYGGEGVDFLEHGDHPHEGDSEDVFYGGDGNDQLFAEGGPRVKLYCGEGRDDYAADKDDYVDSSCEKKVRFGGAA